MNGSMVLRRGKQTSSMAKLACDNEECLLHSEKWCFHDNIFPIRLGIPFR
jgi:hypothetical protein